MSAQQLVQISLGSSSNSVEVRTRTSLVGRRSRKKYWLVLILLSTLLLGSWVVSHKSGNQSPAEANKISVVNIGRKVQVDRGIVVRQSPNFTSKDSKYDYIFDVTVPDSSASFPDYAAFDPARLTSARTSIFYPMRTSYEVGDLVEVRIDARDGMGKPQQAGGDFWFVNIFSPNNFFRTTARLVDHNNGSYSAFFLAAQPGPLELRVRLVHPSDAVRWMREVYMRAEGCFTWMATFHRFELVDGFGRCVIKRGLNHLSDRDDLCFYGANQTGLGESAFICVKPEGFMCADLTTLVAYHQYGSVQEPVDKLIVGKKYLFNDTNFKSYLQSPGSINIAEKTDLLANIYDYRYEIPTVPCGHEDNRGPKLLPEGYWLGPRWVSLVCAKRQWNDVTAVQQCLTGHRILMLGDSVACQWFRTLQRKMGQPDIPEGYYYCSVDQTGILNFRRHTLSAALTAVFDFTQVFEPEYIDTITDASVKYILLISISAHQASWNLDSYRDRMRELRNAIARMRERLGADRVMTIVKKTQPRDHPSFQARIHSNDYIFREMGRILEKEFVGIDAKFIDVWDLALSFKKEPEVHMPWPCINEEVDLFLSHVCPGLPSPSQVKVGP